MLDREEFKGHLYAIYRGVMSYFQVKLSSALIPHGRGLEERLELPDSALREAVLNAIAYRAGLYLPRPRGDRDALGTSCRDAGGSPGQQGRPSQSTALQHALPDKAGRADW